MFIILHTASTDICYSYVLMKLQKICFVYVVTFKLFFLVHKFIAYFCSRFYKSEVLVIEFLEIWFCLFWRYWIKAVIKLCVGPNQPTDKQQIFKFLHIVKRNKSSWHPNPCSIVDYKNIFLLTVITVKLVPYLGMY
jgi:hypothetical protein